MQQIDVRAVAPFDPAAHANLTALQAFQLREVCLSEGLVSDAQTCGEIRAPITAEIEIDARARDTDILHAAFDSLECIAQSHEPFRLMGVLRAVKRVSPETDPRTQSLTFVRQHFGQASGAARCRVSARMAVP